MKLFNKNKIKHNFDTFVIFDCSHRLELGILNHKLTKSLSHSFLDDDEHVARYSQTTRGKTQLLYLGQPFVFEKNVKGNHNTQEKKIWRCNQWWNEKCRARVSTINDIIKPLNKFHTHSHVINRKPRVPKKKISVDFIVKVEQN